MSVRLASSNDAFFVGEAPGDVLIAASTSNQRLLLGNKLAGTAMVSIDSNRTVVTGDVVSHNLVTGTVQGLGVYLGLPDADGSNVSFPGGYNWSLDAGAANSALQPALFGSNAGAAASNRAFALASAVTPTAVEFSRSLTALGRFAASNVATFASNVTIAGRLDVHDLTYQYSNVTVYSTETLHSNLVVNDRMNVEGSVRMGSNAAVVGRLAVNNYGSSNGTSLEVNGALQATADITAFGTISQSSDVSLKADLLRIDGALDRLSALSGYTFRMLRDGPDGPRRMGLVAQEVAAVAPEAVSASPDGTLTVAYGSLMGVVVEAVKELRDEVRALRDATA